MFTFFHRGALATDNHIGYMEKDPVRFNDSLEAFEEVLKIAKSQNVSIRNGRNSASKLGDRWSMYYINHTSLTTIYIVMMFSACQLFILVCDVFDQRLILSFLEGICITRTSLQDRSFTEAWSC